MPTELFSFSPINGKQVSINFHSPEVSPLGGLLLMHESEREVGIISSLTDCLTDKRKPFLLLLPFLIEIIFRFETELLKLYGRHVDNILQHAIGNYIKSFTIRKIIYLRL